MFKNIKNGLKHFRFSNILLFYKTLKNNFMKMVIKMNLNIL